MAIDLYSFPSLLKHIRSKAGLNQEQFASKLGVSKVGIGQFECGAREPTKEIIKALSNKLEISEFALMPFLSNKEIENVDQLTGFERMLYKAGTTLQKELIDKKIHLLK